MLPILLKVGPITVSSLGFFLTLGYLSATFILWREGKRQGYPAEKLLDLSVIGLVAALAGGRLHFVILHWDFFKEELIAALYFWQWGFAFHGALIAVIATVFYMCFRWKWPFFQIADIASIAAVAAIFFGKIGTFLAGLDYGEFSNLPWAVNFPALVGERHPVQIYESVSYLLIFLFLYVLYARNLATHHMKSGKVFFALLIISSLLRVVLEFFRAESPQISFLPTASLLSILVASAATSALYYFQIRSFRQDLAALLRGVLGASNSFVKRL